MTNSTASIICSVAGLAATIWSFPKRSGGEYRIWLAVVGFGLSLSGWVFAP